MILYHGSNSIIEQPMFGKGNTANDYGRGFYCTEHKELAAEWACSHNQDGFVNRYEFDITGLNVLNLNDEKYSILNWLAVLTHYRSYWQQKSIAQAAKEYLQKKFYVDISPFDVIVGYRADDSYFSFAQDFISGVISLRQLEEAMYLGKLGEQIVIKSEEAFERLHFQGYEVAWAEEYYLKKIARDKIARREYREAKKSVDYQRDVFMVDIMRKGLTEDERCL